METLETFKFVVNINYHSLNTLTQKAHITTCSGPNGVIQIYLIIPWKILGFTQKTWFQESHTIRFNIFIELTIHNLQDGVHCTHSFLLHYTVLLTINLSNIKKLKLGSSVITFFSVGGIIIQGVYSIGNTPAMDMVYFMILWTALFLFYCCSRFGK